MLVLKRLTAMAVTIGALLGSAGVALAGVGQPSPWQLNFQQSVTPVMDNIISFHNFLLVIITLITLFVLALLLIIIPVAILVMIAIPSFKLLFYQLNIPPADITVKATGKQWYWSYSYPDNGKFEFDSLLVRDEKQLRPDQPRLLGVDNEMVVPVNKNIRVITTGAEVIHAFAVPSFGVKIDAIPGRINETWFRANREGVYYGQCSELCGKDHAFMPIAVRVVSEQAFNAWVEEAKQKYARDESIPTNVAAAAQSTAR
jgi:cytochrome c oxidase subunit 2